MEMVYDGSEDNSPSGMMSERVETLAKSIYQEFERMIKNYGDDVVKDLKGLMPLVVNVLENLNVSYIDSREHEVELELLRDDNEQLITQYEREKQLRKDAESKYLCYEDVNELEKGDLSDKIIDMELFTKQLELKAKNSGEQVVRLEEREVDMKKELQMLHHRHTEMIQMYMEHIERKKFSNREHDTGHGSKFKLSSASKRPMSPGVYNIVSHDMINNSNDERSTEDQSGGDHHFPTDTATAAENIAESLQTELGLSPQQCPPVSTTGQQKILRNIDVQVTTDSKTVSTGMTSPDAPPLSDVGLSPMTDSGVLTQSEGSNSHVTPPVSLPVAAHHHPLSPELSEISDLVSPISGAMAFSSTPMRGAFHNSESFYDEVSGTDHGMIIEVDEGADITDASDFLTARTSDFSGMGKEVENLIMENTELRQTKDALNIVKDDLIVKVDDLTSEQEMLKEEFGSLKTQKKQIQTRIMDYEDEVKKLRSELERVKSGKEEDNDETPVTQKKRFTRVEMARVLMERNQYKERLMELQEAVRWTEMVRASKTAQEVEAKKSKSTVWKFFSSLIAPSAGGQKKLLQSPVNVKYSSPTAQVTPGTDQRSGNDSPQPKAFEFLNEDGTSQKRLRDRHEQYKQMRTHVNKRDDGRMQAYGWSLPAKFNPSPIASNSMSVQEAARFVLLGVPVPVYCRPLLDKEPTMKIWCAAGVNLSGGKTRDGGSIIGASVFYSDSLNKTKDSSDNNLNTNISNIDKLDNELKEHEREYVKKKDYMTSRVWISTSTHSSSKVTVIDANNPADVLGTFTICNSHILCIASVPGANEEDYPIGEELMAMEQEYGYISDNQSLSNLSVTSADSARGGIKVVGCATGTQDNNNNKEDDTSGLEIGKDVTSATEAMETLRTQGDEDQYFPSDQEGQSIPQIEKEIFNDPLGATESSQTPKSAADSAGNNNQPNSCNRASGVEIPLTTVLPTMWLGTQTGSVYVHSGVTNWNRCLSSIKLKDSVLSIVHIKGRVLVALADGTIAVFHRTSDGLWDLANYCLLDLGRPHHSIRCMTDVYNKVWCGYKNKIYVIQPTTLKIDKVFDAHPRKESQVRQLAWAGDGVWVSIRLDSTLRLYHAHTYQHLQDVDVEPYVSKMLGTGKLGFSFVRITSLMASCTRLWIGTGNGVIISVPLTESSKPTGPSSNPSSGARPGGVLRVYSDSANDTVTPGSFIPYCSMAQAQLSFHGHRDAVKFFVAVPGSAYTAGLSAATTPVSSGSTGGTSSSPVLPTTGADQFIQPSTMLIMSGGEGYIDFRLGDSNDDDDVTTPDMKIGTRQIPKGERNHLIVWQVAFLPE